MIRMLTLLAMAIAGATIAFPVFSFAQAKDSQQPNSNTQSEAARKLRSFLHADWQRWMTEYPEVATHVGFSPGQDDRWTDDSPAGIARRSKHLADSLATLKSIHRADLPAGEQLDFDLYLELLETANEGLQYGDDLFPFRNVVPRNLWMPMTQMGGLQQEAPETLAMQRTRPLRTTKRFSTGLRRFLLLSISNCAFAGRTEARIYAAEDRSTRLPKQIAGLTPADALASPLLQTFGEFPSNFPRGGASAAHRKSQQHLCREHYTGVSQAARLRRFHLPSACRENIAATALRTERRHTLFTSAGKRR